MNDTYEIKLAEQQDHRELTRIAFASKRYWGYPEEWIEGWIDDLTISPSYIGDNYIFKIIESLSERICGFCAIEHHRNEMELEVAHLWIDPSHIGKNLGRNVFEFAIGNLASLPFHKIVVIADPNAQGFYEKLGFVRTGEVESTPADRFLPVMEMIWGT